MRNIATLSCLLKVGAIALLGAAGPALAHHSYAMFEQSKTVTLTGTIKEFRWTNPHTFLQLNVKDAAGREVEWSLEGGSPGELIRKGWKRTLLSAGASAEVKIHPLKNGSAGGQLVSVSVGGVQLGGEQPADATKQP